MSQGYIETEIVEANRLRSEEAITGNNENLASWTNVLGDIYDLKAGDKVSLYSAYISERGAGTNKTIEIKGRTIGKARTFKYVTEAITTEPVTNRKLTSVVTEVIEERELRDNIANLTIGYYKNTDGTGYTTLPRKFFKNMGAGGEANFVGVESSFRPYTQDQDIASNGYIPPIPQGNTPFIIKDDYYRCIYGAKDVTEDGTIVRVKNDNTKFTIFVSKNSKPRIQTGTPINADTPPALDFTKEPEYRKFYRYRELLPIEVESGFSSAQFIAGKLTEKLQLVTKTDELVWSQNASNKETDNDTANIIISKTIESNTYKTFNCMTLNSFTETQFDDAMLTTPTGNTWYNNYQAIAMKRPELFEKGEVINMNASSDGAVITTTSDRILGSELRANFQPDNANEPLRTNIPYTLENLKILKEFINSQELYPEIWESWNAVSGADASNFTYGDGTFYNSNHTINNTRFFHMNCQSNRLQTEIDPNALVTESFTTPNLFISNIGNTTLEIILPDVDLSMPFPNAEIKVDIPSLGLSDLVVSSTTIAIDEVTLNLANPLTQQVGFAVPLTIKYSQRPVYKEYTGTTDDFGALAGDFSLGILTEEGQPDFEFPQMGEIFLSVPSVGQTELVVTSAQVGVNETDFEFDPSTLSVDVPAGTPVKIRYYSNKDIGAYTMLGSSLLRPTNVVDSDPIVAFFDTIKRYSKMLLVYYNKADREVFYDKPSLEGNQLTYGCFGKETYTLDGVEGDFINIFPHVVKSATDLGGPFTLTVPTWFYERDFSPPTPIEAGRKFGYDLHFTAPAQPVIALFNGTQTGVNYYGEQFPESIMMNDWGQNQYFGTSAVYEDNYGYINRRYIGADNPKVKWDGEHFNFSDLHTSVNLSARGPDGGFYGVDNIEGEVGQSTEKIFLTASVPSDEGETIYKINPLQNINEYCPALVPYQDQFNFFTRSGNRADGPGIQVGNPFNKNYQPYTIYDSLSGIFFEDMGYDEDTWDNGLWGIMGFTYAQFNGADNNRLKRVVNTNINSLRSPTTNAEVKVTNTKNLVTNDQGVPFFSGNMPSPFTYYRYAASGVWEIPPHGQGPNVRYLPNFPVINVKTSSLKLTANRFPTSMIRGYYTIRSDIVPRSIFVGGRDNITTMPIVGVVNKENPQSDYYFGGESGVQFTIGQPMKLSSIKVGIFDPDGSYANVNDSSSVLFKIERQVNTSFNIVGEILGQKK